jgi:hypothetical protein
MNLLSKSILRITRKSAQETSYVSTNAVLRIIFDLILAYENILGCRSDQVSVPWVASSPGQGSPVAAALQRVLPGGAAAPPAPCPPEVARGWIRARQLPLQRRQHQPAHRRQLLGRACAWRLGSAPPPPARWRGLCHRGAAGVVRRQGPWP